MSPYTILTPAEVFALSYTEGNIPERIVGWETVDTDYSFPITEPLPLTYEEALEEIEHDALVALMETA